ncbi:hypothetical protein [Caballeronia sp. S22]|uniref:hypothetical protein n=1 Tax=Caballeronia sp. S22 TaxID=3137182 RepID=UPI0035316ED3
MSKIAVRAARQLYIEWRGSSPRRGLRRCVDIEMRNFDGFSVARAMRGSTRLARVPIVAHRSLAEAEVVERGLFDVFINHDITTTLPESSTRR